MDDYSRLSKAELIQRLRQLCTAGANGEDAVLRDSEERLRAILNTAVEGIITIDERGVIESVNPAAEKMFGYSRDEVIGQNVKMLMPSPYREQHDGYLENYHRTGHAKIIGIGREVLGQRKDGTVFALDLSVSEVRLADRRIYTGFIHDVSQWKATEEMLSQRIAQQEVVAQFGQYALRESSLQAVFEHAMVVVAHTLNAELCKVLEILPDGKELILRAGVGWQNGIVGKAKVSAGSESQAGYTLSSKAPVIVRDLRAETRFTGPTLLRAHGVISGMSVIISERERPFGVLGVHTTRQRDFTNDDVHFLQSIANVLASAIEGDRAQRELRESEQRFALAVEASNAGIWDWDLAADCVYYSPLWKRQLGFAENEVSDSHEEWSSRLHPDDRERVLSEVAAYLREPRGAFETEFRMRCKDGSWRWIRSRAGAQLDEHGRPRRLIGWHVDVTDQKRLEQEVSEISSREQQRIGQDLHDDLCQVLAGVALMCGVLKDDLDAEKNPLGEKAARIGELVTSAIDRTRMLARGLSPVALEGSGGLIAALQELADMAERLFHIECRFQYDRSVCVKNNSAATHLYRIAQEALSNAVRHGKAAHVSISLEKNADGDGVCRLLVSDDGIGFSAQPQLTTGMGLRIMQYRASMIGGSVEVRPKRDETGTEVACVFPKNA